MQINDIIIEIKNIHLLEAAPLLKKGRVSEKRGGFS